MSIIYSCNRQKNISFSVWDENVTWEDWLGHVQTVLADPAWLSVSRCIVDMRSVTDTSSIQAHQMGLAAMTVRENRAKLRMPTLRIAVVATHEFRRTSQFQELVSRLGVAMVVFNYLDIACTFLGIDAVPTQQTLEELRATLRQSEKQLEAA